MRELIPGGHNSGKSRAAEERARQWLATPDPAAQKGRWAAAVADADGHVVRVSNETALGVVPVQAETRRFVDLLGLLHRRIAAVCERVTPPVAILRTRRERTTSTACARNKRGRVALIAWPFAAAGLLAATGAVAAEPTPVSITDDRGVTVGFPQPPQRIVTLLPSLTETVCELGACGRLVGTDRFSNWPQSVQILPKLGGLDDAQVERLYALKPDVVLAARSARVLDRLEALGLKVLALDSQSLSDVRRTVGAVATLLQAPQAGAELLACIDAQTQAAAARIPASWRGAQVYFEIASTPHAAGTSSFIGELLAQLGLGNVVPPALGPFPKLNPEFVVRARPDVIMASASNLAEMDARPGWNTIPALRANNSCGFDPTHYELLTRPGPRLGEAAGALADCVAGLPARSGAR